MPKQVNIQLSEDNFQDLRKWAFDQETTVSDLVRSCCLSQLELKLSNTQTKRKQATVAVDDPAPSFRSLEEFQQEVKRVRSMVPPNQPQLDAYPAIEIILRKLGVIGPIL